VLLFAIASALSTLGCGSKTQLSIGEGGGEIPDAAPRDARDARPPEDTEPPPRPSCFDELSPGELRGSIPEIHGRPAYDDEGNLYAPRLDDEDWAVVSYDPCLVQRWSVDLPGFDGRSRRIRTSVDSDGQVWMKGRFEPMRVTTSGAPSPVMLEAEGRIWTWVGIPPAGPVYASVNGTDMPRYLYRTRAGGSSDRVQLEEESSYVWDEECLVGGGAALCWNVGYDLDDLDRRYYHDPPRLLDGTLRNITQPAFDGERIWTQVFGISTYELIATSIFAGRRTVRTPLARTTRGQTDTIISPPVIGVEGEVLVYFSGHREIGPDGQLQAFTPDGEALWSYPANRTRRPGSIGIFGTTSSIAIGDANVAYLAVGDAVHAVVVSTGIGRWTSSGLGDVNDPELSISPLGDIAILDAEDTLHIIATESRTVARTPWPVAGGGPALTYAR